VIGRHGPTRAKEHTMSTNRNNTTLNLRKHSIRTLTPTELRVINGGWTVGTHTGSCLYTQARQN
jgi:hypothetical protein